MRGSKRLCFLIALAGLTLPYRAQSPPLSFDTVSVTRGDRMGIRAYNFEEHRFLANNFSEPHQVAGLSPYQIEKRLHCATAGDQLVVENLPNVVRNSGRAADVASILAARLDGKKMERAARVPDGLELSRLHHRTCGSASGGAAG
jgi:hypothetical protein